MEEGLKYELTELSNGVHSVLQELERIRGILEAIRVEMASK